MRETVDGHRGPEIDCPTVERIRTYDSLTQGARVRGTNVVRPASPSVFLSDTRGDAPRPRGALWNESTPGDRQLDAPRVLDSHRSRCRTARTVSTQSG